MSISAVSSATTPYSPLPPLTQQPTTPTIDTTNDINGPASGVSDAPPSTVVTLSAAAQDPSSQIDATKFPGLAAYARGEKGITLTSDELNEALRVGVIKEGTLKSSMPLSEAWAPQLFVQAGGGSTKLDLNDFTNQLKRVGVSDDNAKTMFKAFDTSGDGSLSLDEYYAGIKAGGSQSTKLFQQLIDTYTRNPDGSVNDQATDQFLAQGSSVADAFWSSRRT